MLKGYEFPNLGELVTILRRAFGLNEDHVHVRIYRSTGATY